MTGLLLASSSQRTGGGRLDDVWKLACVVGVAVAIYHVFGAQAGVSAHGIGVMSWVQLACVAVFLAAACTVLDSSLAYVFHALTTLACVAIVCVFIFLGFYGGPERASEISARLLAVFDRFIALPPGV